MTNFDIKIVSDTVCPWCYVGKKRLEQGIELYRAAHGATDTFSITWKPYYLNPDASRVGVDKQEMYARKFGAERTAMMQQRLSQIGSSVGINFKYGGKTGNTRDSHRLIQLGLTKSPALQTRVVEEFFAAYFENEQDITSHEVLLKAAVKAGLPEAEVKEWLATDLGGPEVDREVTQAQSHLISGVPNFTLSDTRGGPKYAISGAEEPETFLETFERIKQA